MLHVGRPNILNREKFLQRVNQILDHKMLTNDGPMVQELEALFCEAFDVPHAVALCNATVAIEMLIEALAITGEVIMPSFTFVATAHGVLRAGGKPVFCDVDNESSGLMDPRKAEQLITAHTQAIMPVNVYGNVCDVDAFQELADKHNLRLIYDSAHSTAVKFRNKFMGSYGDAEIFSLHATKFINAFEGGIVTTKNAELATKLRSARNFGFITYDTVEGLGTNGKLSEIHAAMALSNLECVDEILLKNKTNYELYAKHLPQPFTLMTFSRGVVSNHQYVVVFCPAELRDVAVETLKQNEVFARKYFYPGVHKHPPYSSKFIELPITDKICSSVICLPTGQEIGELEIRKICGILGTVGEMAEAREGSRDVASV